MSEQQKVQQELAFLAVANEDNDDNCSIAEGWSFETSGAGGGGGTGNCDLLNKMKLNMDALQVKVKMLQTEQKCAKMEAEMSEKSLEQKLKESQQKVVELSKEVDILKEGQQLQKQDFEANAEFAEGWLYRLDKKVEGLEAENKAMLGQNGMDAKKIGVPAWLSRPQPFGQQIVPAMSSQINKTGEILKLLDDTDAIRKRLHFVVANCKQLFETKTFSVNSHTSEVLGFRWHLQAQGKENGTLSLFLYAKPPAHFKGTYRVEIDYRLSAFNVFRAKDVVLEKLGRVFDDANSAWGFENVAPLVDLLDPKKGFLRADGSIEVEADFTIKSATLDHLA